MDNIDNKYNDCIKNYDMNHEKIIQQYYKNYNMNIKLISDIDKLYNNLMNENPNLTTNNKRISNNLNDEKYNKNISDTTINFNINYIFDNNIKLKKINIKDILIKDSATKPIIIPFITNDNKIKKIMYKKDELRKDQLVMNIICICKNIIMTQYKYIDNNIDDINILNNIEYITYDILPFNNKSGIIEIVDNSSTLYDIIYKQKTSITNYILNQKK